MSDEEPQTPDRVDAREENAEANDSFMNAISAGDVDAMNRALASGANPRGPAMQPMWLASFAGHRAALERLIELGLHACDEYSPASCSGSSVHAAAEHARVDLLRVLIERADGTRLLNAFENAETPLAVAARAGHADTVRYLLSVGADVNANDASHIGETALCHAVSEGHTDIVRILLLAGANPDIPGWMGVSARHRSRKADAEIRALIAAVPFDESFDIRSSAQRELDARRYWQTLPTTDGVVFDATPKSTLDHGPSEHGT